MLKLKDFEKPKKQLLKEWKFASEKEHDIKLRAIYYNLKLNINNNLSYEGGESLPQYQDEYSLNKTQLEKLFGLPYTSSGDYAGIWNTNTQARTKYGELLNFRGVALDEDFDTVLIFDRPQKNAIEKTYYFHEYDFMKYQEQEQKREKAKRYGEFLKICNKVKNKALEILKQYEGKQYGEKTRRTIYEKLTEYAETFGAYAWLNDIKYTPGLEIKKYINEKYFYFDFTKCFYFNFTDDDNKIITPTTNGGGAVQDLAEINANTEFEKAQNLLPKLQKKAGELLALITEYNTHARKINQTPKATASAHAIDLERLSRGEI